MFLVRLHKFAEPNTQPRVKLLRDTGCEYLGYDVCVVGDGVLVKDPVLRFGCCTVHVLIHTDHRTRHTVPSHGLAAIGFLERNDIRSVTMSAQLFDVPARWDERWERTSCTDTSIVHSAPLTMKVALNTILHGSVAILTDDGHAWCCIVLKVTLQMVFKKSGLIILSGHWAQDTH